MSPDFRTPVVFECRSVFLNYMPGRASATEIEQLLVCGQRAGHTMSLDETEPLFREYAAGPVREKIRACIRALAGGGLPFCGKDKIALAQETAEVSAPEFFRTREGAVKAVFKLTPVGGCFSKQAQNGANLPIRALFKTLP